MKTFQCKYLIGLLVLGIIGACGGVKKEKQDDKTASAVEVKTDTVVVERIVEKKDTVPVVTPQEAEVIKTDNNLVKEEFYVIGGSFKEVKRANNFKQVLVKKGYKAQVLKPSNGFNRVAIRAYKEETSARKELANLRKVFGDVSFWLLMPS